ncbi:heat shock factor-binding protein 1-like [Clupea harengus]|uniref:Heat shock factor-binding protein 1 n=1 Tax=Clupea harengus TaxID=7950 RepID=A0A6P3WBJ0_CLUHA|nr:heat shock factor-binding protein 1-like [Clupea harengus]
MDKPKPQAAQDLTPVMETTMQKLNEKFQAMSDKILSRMEEMGSRIDDLEDNVADLMRQSGMDECQTAEETPPKRQ